MFKNLLLVVMGLLILSLSHNAYPTDGTGIIKVVAQDFYSEEPVADAAEEVPAEPEAVEEAAPEAAADDEAEVKSA